MAVLPFVAIYFISDFHYPKLPIEIADDSLYYYSRATDIARGDYFLGNPYIKEHKNDITPAFFVADWIWSAPLFLGFSLPVSIIFNQILWFLIFGVLLFLFFVNFRIDKKHIPMLVFFVTIFVYWYLARPISMQIVYPVFVFWLLAFILYLKNSKSFKNIVLLGFATAVSLYIYTYLAQIIFVATLCLLFISFFKKFRDYKTAWISGILAFIFSIPFIFHTLSQIKHPLYFETMYRIGLVNTYTIGFSALIYILLVFSSLALIFFQRNKYSDKEFIFVIFLSISLVITAISNVFTGKDLETAVHIGRFVELWFAIIFSISVYRFFLGQNGNKEKKFFIFFIVLCLVFVFYFLIYQAIIWGNMKADLLRREVYYKPLVWLRENTPKNSVVFSNDNFSSYMPIMTSNYVLFHPNALLYMMSDQEIKERYLVSRIFDRIDLNGIKNDMRKYAGAGYTAHRHMTYNRSVKICRLFRLEMFGKNCGEFKTQYSVVGEKYFEDMKIRYDLLKKNPIQTLKKYDISYVLIDKKNDKWVLPTSFKPIWLDNRFEIYQIIY